MESILFRLIVTIGAAFVTWFVVRTLRAAFTEHRMPTRSGDYGRSERPVMFWIDALIWVAVAAASLALALWAHFPGVF